MHARPHETHAFDRLGEVWPRRKWLALSLFAVCAAAGVTVALSLPPIYRSTATVIVDQPRNEAPGAGDLESRLQLIGQEIFSRSRLEELIVRLDLYPRLRERASLQTAVNQMRRDIHTESKVQPQPSGIGATLAFAISYRGPDAEVVAKVANLLAGLYLEENLKLRGRQASGAVELLKAQVDDVKRNLQEQEKALGDFQDAHLGELPQQSEASLANLQRLHADLRTASEERIRALDRRAELIQDLARAETDAEAATAGARPSPTAERLAKKREELADLSRRYHDKYPDVIRVKDEVALLETQAAQPEPGAPAPSAAARTVAPLREAVRELDTAIGGLRADEASLRAAIAGYIQRLETAPRRQRGYQALSRDYETTRALYDSLRKRYEQAQLEDGGPAPGGSPLRILDPALVPTEPVAPNRLVLLVAALAGSLVMAGAAVALTERFDRTLHSADDVRSFTRVPVAASIPLIVSAGDRRARTMRVAMTALSMALVVGAIVRTVHESARTKVGLVLMLAKGRP